MADPSPAAPPSTPAGSAGEAPTMAINLQYLKDLSFENPRAPQVFTQGGTQPQVQVGVDVGARQAGERMYEVNLSINAQAKQGDDTAFVIELVYAGLFTMTGFAQEQLGPVLLIECPRLLFPFARAIIANATRDGGFPPLMVNPIDFAALYRRQLEERAAAAGPAAAGTA